MKELIITDLMEQKNSIMNRSLVLISLLLMISLSTWSQVALDLKIEKQQIGNKEYIKVLLKNISNYNLGVWADCSWASSYGGFFIEPPTSYLIITGNPNKSDSISTSKRVFPGIVDGEGRSKKMRIVITSGETYTCSVPIWGPSYTSDDGLPLDKKSKIQEIQVKIFAVYHDNNIGKMVEVVVLSNVLKL